MATRGATRRLAKEYQQMQVDPPEYATAKPSERNILEWHYVITGPPETPYHGGQYYGVINFPPDYPFKPPSIKMVTPSGRFQCNTRLCLSISDFHPKSWNPAWHVSTILTGLVSFMTSEEMTTGGLATPDAARKGYARDSWKNNNANSTFCREFPELVVQNQRSIILQASVQSSSQMAENPSGRTKNGSAEKTGSARELRKNFIQQYWMTGVGCVIVIAILTALISDA